MMETITYLCAVCGWELDTTRLCKNPFCVSRREERKVNIDNWLHKSTGMTCKYCMYFVPKNHNIGRCRRHAPTMTGWPAMYPSDWCGDHKIDAERVDKLIEEGRTNGPDAVSRTINS